MMGKCMNSVLHIWVVIKRVAVEVVEFRDRLFEGGVSEKCNNVGFDQGRISESDKAPKTLYKEHDIHIVYVLLY